MRDVERMNLRDTYCRIYRCSDEEFVDRMFWQTLYPHARPLALLLYFTRPTFFYRERELLESLADVTDESQVDRELSYFNRLRTTSWTKARARIRISTRRVRYIGVSCLRLAQRSREHGPLAI